MERNEGVTVGDPLESMRLIRDRHESHSEGSNDDEIKTTTLEVPEKDFRVDQNSGIKPHSACREGNVESEADSRGEDDRRRRVLHAAGLCCDVLLLFLATSILLPFFTGEVLAIFPKHPGRNRHLFIGGALSLALFVEAVGGLLYSFEVDKSSARLVVVLSAAAFAAATVLMAFVNRIRPWSTFVGLCLAVRFFQGITLGFNIPAAYGILFRLFPTSTGTLSGIMRSTVGFGFVTGPAVGGVLYDAGGFALPFLVAGGLVCASALFNWMLTVCLPMLHDRKPAQSAKKISKVSFSQIFRIPRVWALLFAYFFAFCWCGYIEATTAHHVKTLFHTNSGVGGATNMLFALVFASLCLLNGYSMDGHISPNVLLFFGSGGSVVGMLLYGPASIMPITPSLTYHFFSLVPVAASMAALVPAIPVMLFKTLEQHDLGNVVESSSHTVSVLYTTSSVGYAVAFVISPPAVATLGLRTCSSLFAATALVVFLICTALSSTRSLQRGRIFLKRGTLPGDCQAPDLVALNLLNHLT